MAKLSWQEKVCIRVVANGLLLWAFGGICLLIRIFDSTPAGWYWISLVTLFCGFGYLDIRLAALRCKLSGKYLVGWTTDATEYMRAKIPTLPEAKEYEVREKFRHLQDDLITRKYGLFIMSVLLFWGSGIDPAMSWAHKRLISEQTYAYCEVAEWAGKLSLEMK